MIKRIWHGWTTPEQADAYEALLLNEVSRGIEGMIIRGLRGFDMLRRDLPDVVEFVTILAFETLEDVKAFAGEDHELCYVPDAARRLLKRFDERSQHYDVRDARTY